MHVESATWLNLTTSEKVDLVLRHVMNEGDLVALASAVRSYLHARHGWTCVIYRVGEVEFGLEGAGPVSYATAATTEDAICLAALRARGLPLRS